MSELIPSVLALDKGLDLQTAKIIAPQGSVFDSLNYEQVDFQGQKRIEGYARYDGTLLSAVDEFHVLEVDVIGTLPENSLIWYQEKLLGIVVEQEGTKVVYAKLNQNLDPRLGDTIYSRDGAVQSALYEVLDSTSLKDSGVTPEQHYDAVLQYNDILRDRVESLPGPIIGLHWFQDRLYAVANMSVIEVTGLSPIIRPNDRISVSGSGYMKVLDAYQVPARNTQLVFIQTTREFEPDGVMTAEVEGKGTTGLLVEVGAFRTDGPDGATFFESRTEQQAYSEDYPNAPDFGWRARHLGWKVLFTNGITAYGDLVAINQNRQNVGVQGPTSTNGDSGRPLVLLQKPVITNAPPQVNGWKSSNSRTSYSVAASDVQNVDTNYVYADAFISWDADGAVVAPGSDMVGLVEYPATNTIRLEA